MNLELTTWQEDFLKEVREFVDANLPLEIKHKVDNFLQLSKQDHVTWQKTLFEKGWIAPHWPRQYGGCEWDAVTRYLFEEELSMASCPRTIPFGLNMPQHGISFLLIDMKSEGVSVSPIRTIDGGEEINDVFLGDVRVPVENRVGEEGQGWTIAKFLLGHERAGIAGVGRSKRQLARLKEIASKQKSGSGNLLQDHRFVDRITDVEIDLMALEYTTLRVLSEEASGKPPGAAASLLKIKGTEVQQDISELMMDAIGYYALPCNPDAQRAGLDANPAAPDYEHALAPYYLNWRKTSIYGGTNEIQKNIIAKMVLGI